MSKKCNVRSFRFSDEVAAILEGMNGKSMNDSFEQLVLECYYKLPDLQKQCKELQEKIDRKRKELRILMEEIGPAVRCVDQLATDISTKYTSLLKTFDRVSQLSYAVPDSKEDV